MSYCVEFLRGRLARGVRPSEVLAEFGIDEGHWPAGEDCDEWAIDRLARFVADWVATCREQAAIAEEFAAAEYVALTPAFGDCTGRFVDVAFSHGPEDDA